MKACFKIDAELDLRLLPYSPAYERDTLDIRAQAYNGGEDGETELVFCFDKEHLCTKTMSAKSGEYAFASFSLPLKGLAGEHTISVNGAKVPLSVLKEPVAALDGGFVMLGPPNDRRACDSFRDTLKSFTDSDWKNYVNALSEIGQRCIIIMVSHQYLDLDAKKIVAHYPSSLFPKSDIRAEDPIEAILDAADENSQNIFIGIGNNYGYVGATADMDEIYSRYKAHKSFYGWYMAEELNMKYFNRASWERQAALVAHSRKITPAKPVLTSPMNIPCPEFLDYIPAHDFGDIVMPQDWVGQKILTLAESDEMYRMLKKLFVGMGKHLWANCESFNFTDDRILVPRFRDGGMDGEAGFVQQMKTVRPYVEKIMNFMFSGFFAPVDFTPNCGGKAAVKQYLDYLKYAKSVTNRKICQSDN